MIEAENMPFDDKEGEDAVNKEASEAAFTLEPEKGIPLARGITILRMNRTDITLNNELLGRRPALCQAFAFLIEFPLMIKQLSPKIFS